MYGSPQPQRPETYASPTVFKKRQPRSRHAQANRTAHKHKLLLWELTAQISVNCVLVGVAIASIVQLLPKQLNQQQRLNSLQGEVSEAEKRVKQLRTEFNRNFDAYGSAKLMQEHTLKVDPKQRRIIWLEPKPTAIASQAQESQN